MVGEHFETEKFTTMVQKAGHRCHWTRPSHRVSTSPESPNKLSETRRKTKLTQTQGNRNEQTRDSFERTLNESTTFFSTIYFHSILRTMDEKPCLLLAWKEKRIRKERYFQNGRACHSLSKIEFRTPNTRLDISWGCKTFCCQLRDHKICVQNEKKVACGDLNPLFG